MQEPAEIVSLFPHGAVKKKRVAPRGAGVKGGGIDRGQIVSAERFEGLFRGKDVGQIGCHIYIVTQFYEKRMKKRQIFKKSRAGRAACRMRGAKNRDFSKNEGKSRKNGKKSPKNA